jgi:periplasmic divalent cation tolerance protein
MSSDEDRPVVVLTTVGLSADVMGFARRLVTDRIAACVNVLPPMTSVYEWKGALQEDSEYQLVIKTMTSQIPGMAARFAAEHPYEVPEFVVVPVSEVSEAYGRWLRASVGVAVDTGT